MSAPPAVDAANLYEVFSSVQGEATHVGERHLFVRMAGCDLECLFCDTPASRRIPPRCRLHLPGGVEEIANPVPAGTLDEAVRRLDAEAGPHHAIALTGGEPLLFVDYLLPLAGRWRERGLAILLETGGHRPRDLERMLPAVDWVMADIKLPSAAGFGTEEAVVRDFLAVASARECCVKIVVSAQTTGEEIEGAARLAAASAPEAWVILQPVTGARFPPPSGAHLLDLQRAAMRANRRVRVIPQTHKILRVR